MADNRIDDWQDVDDWKDVDASSEVDDWQDVEDESILQKFSDFGNAVQEGIPFSGLANKAGAATAAGIMEVEDLLGLSKEDKNWSDRYNEMIQRDKAESEARSKRSPGIDIAGNVIGGLAAPGFGAGKTVKSIVGAGLGNAAMNAADQAVKEDSIPDALNQGGKAALFSAGISALPLVGKGLKEAGKLTGKAFTGIPTDVAEHYLKHSDKVDAAKPLKEITEDFLKKTDDITSDLGRKSSESFQALRESGIEVNKNTFTDMFLAEIDRLKELGVYGPERERAVSTLKKFMKNINEGEVGDIGLDKGKALINQLDSTIGGLMKKPDADTQVVNSFLDIRKQIDNMLKESVPEYAEQMTKLADETKTVRNLSDRFRAPKGAQDLLKRTQTGKDGYADDALAAFDKKFGTKYQDELRDSFVKDAFTKDATRGSRNVNVGAIAGSMGGMPGAIAGAAVGHVADKFGGPIYKQLLKAGIKARPYMQILENASSKGNLPLTHYLMMRNDPEYREIMNN